jgi:tetratricopeptide (TPR) repeat protein
MKISDAVLRFVGATDPNCPGEDGLFAYIENRLSTRNRAQLERHFAQCDDCRELLGLVARVPEQVFVPLTDQAINEQTDKVLTYIRSERTGRAGRQREVQSPNAFAFSYARLAAAMVVIIVIGITVIFFLTRDRSRANYATQALEVAVKDARFSEARVSGGLPYSRYSVTRGGAEDKYDLAFTRVLADLKEAEQESAPANDRLALARVYLARGRFEDAQRALEILTQVSARGIETPEALNDKGVAELQLKHYGNAIAYFTKALAKLPSYEEALFNEALAEERSNRSEDAARDWQLFIDQSPDSGWKSEAESHLKSLSVAPSH